MRIDGYTKGVLTIIAVALLWIAAGGPSVLPALEAQNDTPQRVVIVGWQEGSNSLPLPVRLAGWSDLRGNQHRFPEPFPVERARQQGAGLPTGPER